MASRSTSTSTLALALCLSAGLWGCSDDSDSQPHNTGASSGTGGSGGAGGAGASGGSGADGGSGGQADTPLEGIYDVTGTDPVYGAYTGRAEVRDDGGETIVIHTQIWDDADFEGDRIGLVWQGTLDGADSAPYDVEVALEPVGFIDAYDGLTRDGVDPTPVTFTASLDRTAFDTLEGEFASAVLPAAAFSETWTYASPPGAEPMWTNQRQVIASHDPVPAATKATLFQTYSTFHALPDVQPYVNRPEFNEAMHYFVFDPTDYDFYQQNPDVVRVIQKIVDPISLAEARLRNRAYRDSLADKAAYFEAEMPLHHLNTAGSYCHFDPNADVDHQFDPSGDSTIWTGLYAASQAMRYLDGADDEAYENMILALDGLILMFDIAPSPGDFARAVRPHLDDGDPDFVQGLGAYDVWDWRPGANNDMLKGYTIGFTWAWFALQAAGGDPVRQAKMEDIVQELIDDSPIGGDNNTNELQLHMMLWMMTGDVAEQLEYLALFTVLEPFLIDQGNGSTYEYGTSDWSGNHLTVQSLLTPTVIAGYMGDSNLDAFRVGLRHAQERLSYTRLGLHQLITSTLGDWQSPPPEQEDALWVMREMSAPKVRHHIDWRIHPSFCMSPFPNLPWKNDWETSNRTNGLFSYPRFEKNQDDVNWKENPLGYRGAESEVLDAGADFLFAYWFARYHGVISPTD